MPQLRVVPVTTPESSHAGPRGPHHSKAAATPVLQSDRITLGDAAQTHWQRTFGGRQAVPTSTDSDEAARLVAHAHGHTLARVAAQRGAIDIAQNRYDADFTKAARMGPLDAKLLKSQDYQESNLTATAAGGGIAQLDPDVAQHYGVTNVQDPAQAIRAQATYEHDTAASLGKTYARYGGDPTAPEFQKFVLGAYNAGEKTIADAMQTAHHQALARARRSGLAESDARAAADRSATTWSALFRAHGSTMQSPFYRAVQQDLTHVNPAAKYDITKSYVDEILARAHQ